MNKTDRLLAIVLRLQSTGRQRAEDLASYFETSKRTIYRDIQALSEAGVPIVSVPGQGYSLLEGYFLPPLTFTSEEAVMLLLGSAFVAEDFDAYYQRGAKSAGLKLEGVLPETVRQEVNLWRERLRFLRTSDRTPACLPELHRAVLESRTVRFIYHSRTSPEKSGGKPREADPYYLVFYEGAWYMRGYCHLRKEHRRFRLDRMERVELTSRTFSRPAEDPGPPQPGQEEWRLHGKVLFDPEVARWVEEQRNFYAVRFEMTPEGLLVTLRARREEDVVPWILSWGSKARVLEPPSLIRRVAEEAEKISQIYKVAPSY